MKAPHMEAQHPGTACGRATHEGPVPGDGAPESDARERSTQEGRTWDGARESDAPVKAARI